jgi:hypothetical protein
MDLLIIILVLIYLLIATISDIKTQEIPDFLNFSFIAIGIFIYATKTILTGEIIYFLTSLITSLSFLTLGLIMYYTRQWGGGDGKILMGLGALIPVYPSILIEIFSPRTYKYFGIDLLINLLLIGAIYGLLFATYLGIKHRKEYSKKLKELYKAKKTKKLEKLFWATVIIINILSYFLLKDNFQRIMILIFSSLFLLLNYLLIVLKAIEKITMYKMISTKKLREGDYIIKKLKKDEEILFTPTVHGVNKNQIQKIQENFSEVEILSGIAFAPAILISTIVTLIFGNLLLYLLP